MLSNVYLFSLGSISDPSRDVLLVQLNNLTVTTLHETRTTAKGNKETVHLQEVTGNYSNVNNFSSWREFDIVYEIIYSTNSNIVK